MPCIAFSCASVSVACSVATESFHTHTGPLTHTQESQWPDAKRGWPRCACFLAAPCGLPAWGRLRTVLAWSGLLAATLVVGIIVWLHPLVLVLLLVLIIVTVGFIKGVFQGL